MKLWSRSLLAVAVGCLFSTLAQAGDLDEVKARGTLRHLGIPYANFVSGAGDGMDVELVKRFAAYLGVKYEFVQSDWGSVVQDLTGRKIRVAGGKVEELEEAPVRGDVIANGFTIIPWRQQVVAFGTPTFPNQIWLVAREDSRVRPIRPTGDGARDVARTKALMKYRSVLSMEKTCLDPALYSLAATGARIICRAGNLNEMAPAVLNREADLTILDVPDALVALSKWPGKLKIIGPVSDRQQMAPAFAPSSPRLLEAYNAFIRKAQHDGSYLALVRKYYPAAPTYFPAFFRGMK